MKKYRLNWLEFFKNQPVRFGFGFISLKLKKLNRTQTRKNSTEPKPKKTKSNRKKTEQNWKNQAKPSQTETGRFEPVSVWFFKKTIWLLFYKNRTENNHL
jgi:hypothetical protein